MSPARGYTHNVAVSGVLGFRLGPIVAGDAHEDAVPVRWDADLTLARRLVHGSVTLRGRAVVIGVRISIWSDLDVHFAA